MDGGQANDDGPVQVYANFCGARGHLLCRFSNYSGNALANILYHPSCSVAAF